MAEEKGNGGELILIFILVLIVVAGAFYFVMGNKGVNDTESTVNIEIPDNVDIIPNEEGNQ